MNGKGGDISNRPIDIPGKMTEKPYKSRKIKKGSGQPMDIKAMIQYPTVGHSQNRQLRCKQSIGVRSTEGLEQIAEGTGEKKDQ